MRVKNTHTRRKFFRIRREIKSRRENIYIYILYINQNSFRSIWLIQLRGDDNSRPAYSISFTEDRFYLSVHIRERWIIYASSALSARSHRAPLYSADGAVWNVHRSIFRHVVFLVSTSRSSPASFRPSLPAHLPQLNIGIDFHGSGRLALGAELACKVALYMFFNYLHIIYVCRYISDFHNIVSNTLKMRAYNRI